jgi:hypothetical protein
MTSKNTNNSASYFADAIGDIVDYAVPRTTKSMPDMSIPCRVLDGRALFGRDEYKIKPVDGYGERWVSGDSISFRNT